MAEHGSTVRKTLCPIRMKQLCMQYLPLLEPETDPIPKPSLGKAQPLVRLGLSQKWLLGAFYFHTPSFSEIRGIISGSSQDSSSLHNPLLPMRNGHPCSCHSRKRLQRHTRRYTTRNITRNTTRDTHCPSSNLLRPRNMPQPPKSTGTANWQLVYGWL